MQTTVATIEHRKPPATKAEPRRRITAKVKAAVDLMVWQGLKRDEAAQRAGLKDNSLYVAFMKPDVRSYYLAQCEVLRTSGRARRLHRLEAMVEQDDNKQAVINACNALDRQENEAAAASHQGQIAGFVINIVTPPAAPAQPLTIDHE